MKALKANCRIAKMNRRIKYAALLVVLIALALSLSTCANKKEAITSVSQLNDPNITIGVAQDTAEGKLVEKDYPKANIQYIRGEVEAYTSVSQGKIDAFIFNKVTMQTAMVNGLTGVRILDESVGEPVYSGVAFSPVTKVPDLENSVNAFVDELTADGTLDEMTKRWIGTADAKMPNIPKPSNPQKHVVIGTTGANMPYTYYSGTDLTGYDIELAYRFALWFDASIEFKVYDYSGIVPAAQSGDIDCIFANMFITPERQEALHFSHPTSKSDIGVMVKDDSAANPIGNIRNSFYKTFVREGRYRLFIKGIGMTLLITILAVLCGSILGFSIFMACRRGNRIANGFARTFNWLMNGMPIVVLLMILYYIVFASTDIPGSIVAALAFTLTFGAEVYSMLRTAVGTIDIGQTEAAYTLGYTDLKAFFRHILPQAMPHFMPPYKAALVNLVKATSIVGYVGVQDLTKVADIVRSRTYEAFFPLIAIAVIYFILAGILVFFIDRLMNKLDPTKRKAEDILKGVRTHD
ncbi:MAG: ABC transporter substrate-binding protein/permease [Mogibacterium sp.]|nr:ABC transporter substrate-binding protein/permease [Mogibacterium sp.]